MATAPIEETSFSSPSRRANSPISPMCFSASAACSAASLKPSSSPSRARVAETSERYCWTCVTSRRTSAANRSRGSIVSSRRVKAASIEASRAFSSKPDDSRKPAKTRAPTANAADRSFTRRSIVILGMRVLVDPKPRSSAARGRTACDAERRMRSCTPGRGPAFDGFVPGFRCPNASRALLRGRLGPFHSQCGRWARPLVQRDLVTPCAERSETLLTECAATVNFG